MSPDEAELIERYRDGVLDPAERAALDARLRADPEFKRIFVAEVRMGGQIAAIASISRAASVRIADDPAANDAPNPARPRSAARSRRRSRPRWPGLWLALAASVAACVVAAVMLAPGPAVAAIVALTPGVELTRDGKTAPAQATQALRAGDELRVPAGGSAELRFADGTDVQLAGGTQASVTGGSRRGMDLGQGALQAEVAKQAPGTAMAFTTADAQALVIGTRLELAIVDGGTRLRVSEGRVSFAPRAGGGAVLAHALMVVTGETAMVSGGSAALVASAPAAPGADHTGAEDERSVAALAAVIAPHGDEESWLAMGWDCDLWHARRRAQAEGKPMLLWAGWGDPLAMASRECLDDRRNLWSDAKVQALARSRFIPVAADAWFLSRRGDRVGRFFAQLVEQAKFRSDVDEGIFCCTASGTLLAAVPCGCERGRAWEAFQQALQAAAAPGAPILDPGAVASALDPHPTADALIGVVHARRVRMRDDGGFAASGSGPPGREALWLPAAAWRALLPGTLAVGSRVVVPAAVVGVIARNALVDSTRGECSDWERAEVVAASLTSEVVSLEPTVARLRLLGSVSLAGADRAYAPTLRGSLDCSLDQRRVVRFELVALGAWREGGAQAPDAEQLGIAVRLADQQDPLAHPHGARSPDSLSP